jgi:hypothetical protein
MALVEIRWNPSRSELRQFALLFFPIGALALSAMARFRWHQPSVSMIAVVAAAAVFALGLARPAWVRPLYVGMMVAAFPIGFVVSHLLLFSVYFAVVAPIGLAMRLAGRDPLGLRFDRSAKSYWVPRMKRNVIDRYFRQF